MRNRERKVVGCGFAVLCQTTRQQDFGFARQPDNETTRGAVAGWLRRNHGLTELWNYGKGKPAQSSQPFYTFSTLLLSIPFSLLPFVVSLRSGSVAANSTPDYFSLTIAAMSFMVNSCKANSSAGVAIPTTAICTIQLASQCSMARFVATIAAMYIASLANSMRSVLNLNILKAAII